MTFTYSGLPSQNIYDIKERFRQQRNNEEAKNAFNTILNETQIAISNINEIIKSETELRQLVIKLRHNDISFAKDVLGLAPKGKNGSYYRAFLAMDEKNIIEIRFANHYETKNAASEKSNNKSQFLFQVVLVTPKTKVTSNSN